MSTRHPDQRPSLCVRRLLPALPHEVFDAWTDPDSLKEWMCPGTVRAVSAQLDVRVGGSFRITMHGDTGDVVHTEEYREVRPGERLVFTWCSSATNHEETLVTLEFHRAGTQTELVLTHEYFPTRTSRDQHERGWREILDKLEGGSVWKTIR